LVGSVLLVVASILTVYLLSRDEPPLELSGLTLRARFRAVYRRHPRGRGVQMACAVVGMLLFIIYAIAQFT
jgi:hypothetical protein